MFHGAACDLSEHAFDCRLSLMRAVCRHFPTELCTYYSSGRASEPAPAADVAVYVVDRL